MTQSPWPWRLDTAALRSMRASQRSRRSSRWRVTGMPGGNYQAGGQHQATWCATFPAGRLHAWRPRVGCAGSEGRSDRHVRSRAQVCSLDRVLLSRTCNRQRVRDNSHDPARRLELMTEAENGIADGCVGHNQYRVYADGIDVACALADPEKLRRYVRLLDAYPEGETVAWSTFHALRGRALLNFLEDGETARAGITFRRASELGNELGMHFWRPDKLR